MKSFAGSLVWCRWVSDFLDQVLFFYPEEEISSVVLDPRGFSEDSHLFYRFDESSWLPTHVMVMGEEWE